MESDAYTAGAKLVSEFDDDLHEMFNALSYSDKISYIRGYFDVKGNITKSMFNPMVSF